MSLEVSVPPLEPFPRHASCAHAVRSARWRLRQSWARDQGGGPGEVGSWGFSLPVGAGLPCGISE